MINLLSERFEKRSLEKLKEKGFVPKQIIQFCDNCVGQYKSKGPFQFISEAGIPTLRMFFRARHGKGPADRVLGRIKDAAKNAVRSHHGHNVECNGLLEFCTNKYYYKTFDKYSSKPQYFI